MLAAPLMSLNSEHTDDAILAAMKKLHYPVMATLKKDGIRGLRLNSNLLSRTFKRIPNFDLCTRSMILPGGADMELWNKDLAYHEIESIVMSRNHPDTDKIQFHLLDWVMLGSYAERVYKIMEIMPNYAPAMGVKFSPPVMCDNAEQLIAFFLLCEEEAGEGICFRTPTSPYKQGRSTLKEQYLVKLARYITAEAVIVGFVEQMENTNGPQWNRAGKMDRSSELAGMVGKNTLGAFVVRPAGVPLNPDNLFGDEFKIGTGIGLDDNLRKEIWDNQDKYLGRVISYRSKPHGKKTKPRSPTFRGFRDKE